MMMKKAGQAARLKRATALVALMLVALLGLGQGANAAGTKAQGQAAKKGPGPGSVHGESVPEINPALLMGSLVLVVGAALILTDRARARRPD